MQPVLVGTNMIRDGEPLQRELGELGELLEVIEMVLTVVLPSMQMKGAVAFLLSALHPRVHLAHQAMLQIR